MPKVSGLKRWLTKISNWEYWPFSIIYFPVFFYYGWLILKTRSFFFFTAANPSIEFGGMFGEKKSDIFSLIPEKYLPKTILIKKGEMDKAIKEGSSVGYPLIAKPDVGERGTWVKKIGNEAELENYAQCCPVDFLIQELVQHPIELGVFYVRHPDKSGRVTSIVRKEFLKVKGDGKSSIKSLLESNPRAVLQVDFSMEFLRNEGNRIPQEGEEVMIEPIGNHCRGTKFLNDEKFIDKELNEAIDMLAMEVPELYFGRFDLKCESIEDLKKLQNFKILELNGAGSEPGHIYQPGYSLIKAYKSILWHLGVLADISIQNHKRGVPYWSFSRGYKKWRAHQKYNRLLSHS